METASILLGFILIIFGLSMLLFNKKIAEFYLKYLISEKKIKIWFIVFGLLIILLGIVILFLSL